MRKNRNPWKLKDYFFFCLEKDLKNKKILKKDFFIKTHDLFGY